jgi:hypothetical protein
MLRTSQTREALCDRQWAGELLRLVSEDHTSAALILVYFISGGC